ncbi:hypothetical protein OX88_24595 [Pseudomonas coronafaciens pv. porri]|uniref:hypothetical protein n=1 Tax=Pseudomonas coronafaciens TaxID=53409 RepID=UPI0006ABBF5C|nr:hypothetical protein [Pseudomonas coronafaciens]KOP51986.1 hypothetical protein OX88_24595 [Pseudomonas coronafaciens pv. porri]
MSNFHAQYKHKLIDVQSPKYSAIVEADEFLSSCASSALAMVKDTGFNLVGFADLRATRYFVISKLGREGDMLEIPITTQILDIYTHANEADIQKYRMKKALIREDTIKFTLELVKFADIQFAELNVSFP